REVRAAGPATRSPAHAQGAGRGAPSLGGGGAPATARVGLATTPSHGGLTVDKDDREFDASVDALRGVEKFGRHVVRLRRDVARARAKLEESRAKARRESRTAALALRDLRREVRAILRREVGGMRERTRESLRRADHRLKDRIDRLRGRKAKRKARR